jgi:hypothetical protein
MFGSSTVSVVKNNGTRIIKVNPRGTSQHCSRCLNRVSKTLSDRWHDCNSCNLSCDRDYNSALLVKRLAVGSSQDKKLPSLLDLRWEESLTFSEGTSKQISLDF